jgi:hypothetical protein
MELVNYVIINGYRGSFHPRSKLAGYSTEINNLYISITELKNYLSSEKKAQVDQRIWLGNFSRVQQPAHCDVIYDVNGPNNL